MKNNFAPQKSKTIKELLKIDRPREKMLLEI
jgi:hypothetical protein